MFTTLPAWTIPARPDMLALFETIELAGLTGQWVRLDAATQRAVIGFAVFGKQEFMVKDDGEIYVCRSTCFGNDCEIGAYTPAHMARAVAARGKVSPGVHGKGYYTA